MFTAWPESLIKWLQPRLANKLYSQYVWLSQIIQPITIVPYNLTYPFCLPGCFVVGCLVLLPFLCTCKLLSSDSTTQSSYKHRFTVLPANTSLSILYNSDIRWSVARAHSLAMFCISFIAFFNEYLRLLLSVLLSFAYTFFSSGTYV